MQEGTGAGVIFGATGGVMEAALRSAYYIIKGQNPPVDAFTAVRSRGFNENDGVQEANFQINDITIRTAVVSGLSNARALLQKIERGEVHYDFVEVMHVRAGVSAAADSQSMTAKSEHSSVVRICTIWTITQSFVSPMKTRMF